MNLRRKKGKKQGQAFNEIISRWYFVLVILIFAITSVLMLFGPGGWGTPALVLLLLSVFCGVFYVFGRMNLFGGADAWALIFIAFCIPTFPFTPLLGDPPLGFLAFSVLINALILNMVAPVAIFVMNVIREKPGTADVYVLRVPGKRREDPARVGICHGGFFRKERERQPDIHRLF